MEPVKRIAIVGHGLIGGSIRLALEHRTPGVTVTALDRGDDLSAAGRADLIVLAAPISENLEILRELPSKVNGPVLVTDVGSTKASTV